jgi:WD repeat-containing protein 19
MAWSRVGPQLAVGTQKGNLLLYNNDSKKSQLLAGKHSKKITCGQWNLDNKLALASLDRTMTINEASGELLEQAKLKSVRRRVRGKAPCLIWQRDVMAHAD